MTDQELISLRYKEYVLVDTKKDNPLRRMDKNIHRQVENRRFKWVIKCRPRYSISLEQKSK